MGLNSRPLRPISEEDIATYARDGVVCLRQVFDPDWIRLIEPVARRITVDKEDVGLLPTAPGRYMSRLIPEFRRFVFEGPAAEAAGRVMQSKEIRFFFDEMFAKPPRSDQKTIWHVDRMGWPVTGVMVPSLWIPLGPVSKENCLECFAGSQHEDVPYWLFSPNARKMIRPEGRASHPDVEPRRATDPDKFRTWDMEPGDMLVVHPWTLHYSAGNTDDDWRIAVSVRVFGDDIRWAPRPDCLNIAGVSMDEMVEGDPPEGDLFPLLWSEDGQRDDDSRFPRGFATRWTKARRAEVNEYDTFKALQDKMIAEAKAKAADPAPAT
jgi:ectoine hydroxylase-related dioxygenase (phytanoyl-CoA dioxygenase family)